MTPRATYRLQFHKGFTFADAIEVVPYLARLGVSHLYASPITTARPGSTHGYDVIDPTRINPELGGEAGFSQLVAAAKADGLGLIIDIVPNHMAASWQNAWWFDVLRLGRASEYAGFFDIDWQREDGKILLPVLGKPLKDVLDAGELVPVDDGTLRYFDNRFPLNPDSTALEAQHYRLAWWRSAGDRINWRRFFEINDLVSLRQDDDATFEATHALVLRLYGEGAIAGVRIDHIDGLADPAGYCRKLRDRLGPDAYIVVEKILLGGESLPSAWACQGTTGYDFMDAVSALQHDPAADAPLAEAWAELSGRPGRFAIEEEAARREMLARSFGAQLEACVDAFDRVARADPSAADLAKPALRRVVSELLAHFPVYRTYGHADEDIAALTRAGQAARRSALPGDAWALDHLLRWLGSEPDSADNRQALTRFRQLSAPIAAKAVEDTGFYRYGRLLSRNDVGFDTARLAESPAEFLAAMTRRQRTAPHSMLATATHDHKRGEDVRARLAVLSEMAPLWLAHLRRWLVLSAPLRSDGAPSDADLAMLFQMIVGAWPLDLALHDEGGRAAFAERLAAWQEKALREAKLHTDWIEPNADYESSARRFVIELVAHRAHPELLEDIAAFVERIAASGAINGLTQALLKLTLPGVPDLYQGTEFWDFSLVDPDNRRPVDFTARDIALGTSEALLPTWRDGRIKQAVIARALAVRQMLPDVFANGSFEPLAVHGPAAQHLLAFLRRHGDDAILVIAPLLPHALLKEPRSLDSAAEIWRGISVEIPESLPAFTDVFSDRSFKPDGDRLALEDDPSFPVMLLSNLPLA